MTEIIKKLHDIVDIKENYSLSNLTTFKIGGPAKYLIEVDNINNLPAIFKLLKKEKIPFYILGGGANVLASDDGYIGAIIKIVKKECKIIKENSKIVLVHADAGLNWDDFVATTVENKWWGAENMSYIPGSVGGVMAVSAGAYGQQVSDFVKKVNIFDIDNNAFIEFTNKQCEFEYRRSFFTEKGSQKYIILSAEIELAKNKLPSVNYPDIIKYFVDKNIINPSILQVREAVYFIRSNKLPDCNLIGSAGSFFRNIYLPTKDVEKFMVKVGENFGTKSKNQAEMICKKFVDSYGCKIPTGFVLDKLLDLKGKEMGGAKVYEKQALVIINNNNASAKDVIMLVSYIKQQVRDKLNVQLHEEVKYLGFE